MRRAIAVTDFGTSSVKIYVVNGADGKIILSRSAGYRMYSDARGYCELDLDEMWETAQRCMRELVLELPGDCRIELLNWSFFGASTVPVDASGHALDRAILCFDCRGAEEAEDINAAVGKERYIQITGGECDPSSMTARILWYRKHRPEIAEKAAAYWTCEQFVLAKMGFSGISEYTMASKTEMLDDRTAQWSEEILGAAGIKQDQMGIVVRPEQCIGTTDHYGDVPLPESVKVLPGLHDAIAGFLGAGLYKGKKGLLAEVTGTFDHVGMLTEHYINCQELYPGEEIWSSMAPGEDSSACIACYPVSGALLEWFMREMASGTAYEELWQECDLNEPSGIDICPEFHLGNGRISSLCINSKKPAIFQGIIEALSFETRRCIEVCEKISDSPMERVRICGGEARADIWTQFRADITGKIYELPEVLDCSMLGAAIAGAVSLDIHHGYADAVEHMVRIEKYFYPDPVRQKKYEQKYETYRKNL